MMSPLQFLQQHFEQAFEACGLPKAFGKVTRSDRPDLAQFQCNGALAAAKQAKANPRAVAEQVLAKAAHPDLTLDIAGPGFINIAFSGFRLVEIIQAMAEDSHWGLAKPEKAENYLVEYASPNVAKAMHVGHLRSGVIGDTLRRLLTFMGYNVLSINHWGDWGTPMGMVLLGLEQRAAEIKTSVDKLDITVDLLAEIYPKISGSCKEDQNLREEAKAITVKLQKGDPHYRALWQKMVTASKDQATAEFASLNIHLDKMYGESDAHDRIAQLVDKLKVDGIAVESEGALVVPMDDEKIPPLILYKSDGGVMYGTTDLATIAARVEGVDGFKPDHIWYVVDHRQSLHFKQLFEAARRAKLLKGVMVEHLPFGTMNGADGKPFKTRDGGVLNLKDLVHEVRAKAYGRLQETGLEGAMIHVVSQKVAVATLRFADLSVHRISDYVFDVDKFSSFEGKTGPYLQYTAVRIKSLLSKPQANSALKALTPPENVHWINLLIALGAFPHVIEQAFEERAPNVICDHAFTLAQTFSSFYASRRILDEPNPAVKGGLIELCRMTERQLITYLDILGIEVPAKM